MQIQNGVLAKSSLSGRLFQSVRDVRNGMLSETSVSDVSSHDLVAQSQWRSPAVLARRINVPWHFASPELQERVETISEFEALAQTSQWPELLERIKELDQTRAQRLSGARIYEAALLAARSSVSRNLEDRRKADQARAGLETLKAICATHPDSYVAAVILAQAHMDMGWAERGGEHGKASAAGLAAFRKQFSIAEQAISKFDPIEENSPMLAETRYLLAPGVEGGVKFLRDWYEDWADLDPSNPKMLETHSRYLMPQWYGDYTEVDKEARRAAVRSNNELGSGAYALFWLTPMTREESLGKLDADLFIKGLHDLMLRTGDQGQANAYAAKLFRIGHRSRGRTRRVSRKGLRMRARLEKGFEEIIRHHLREIHTMHWCTDDAGIRAAIARIFDAELGKGAFIQPGSGGLEAVYLEK